MRRILASSIVALALSGCFFVADIPLDDARSRPTPLHFGLYVTPDPETNPIDPPERFTGFHAATDFEIVPGEENEEVVVYAACGGPIIFSGYAEGYGGAVVHRCMLNDEPVTVLYGHLLRSSLPAAGSMAVRGEKIAVLAPANSVDSGDTRKHLHFSIHRGEELELLGYVQTEQELERFVDPLTVLP